MTKDVFTATKENLIHLIMDYLSKSYISEQEKKSFNKLLEILNQYSFENRLEIKGLLSHTIIDSLELDYSLGEKFIKFDNDIK